eukprot:CCRYP_018678-RA/>CCRYP_018678-RA protein AED:0.38 eAED:-0.87 QI:0/0/0/0.5/1/1/2/0/308
MDVDPPTSLQPSEANVPTPPSEHVLEDIHDMDVDPPLLETPATLGDQLPDFDVPSIPSQERCDLIEFLLTSTLSWTREESHDRSSNFRPLFKTKEEALKIVELLSQWNEVSSSGKRKREAHTKAQYRMCNKYQVTLGTGTNALCHRENGLCIAIYEDLFDVIHGAHVGMGHSRTARNILNELKNSWFGITLADVQLLINLCPTCVGKTSRIKASQAPLKMLFSPTIGHRAQVDLIDMTSAETIDGFKWIVRYRDHHSSKCDVGATKDKTAAEVAPVVIRIMASTLVPNILQSDNGGEFLGETLSAVNR